METLKLDAFNLIVGAVISGDNGPLVVAKVGRDADQEVVYGRYRDGEPFAFDYSDRVALVGLCVNHTDVDDDNFGN